MVQRRRGACLISEAFHSLGILHNLGRQKFQRYGAPERGVFRAVHHTHSAATERIQQTVMRDYGIRQATPPGTSEESAGRDGAAVAPARPPVWRILGRVHA